MSHLSNPNQPHLSNGHPPTRGVNQSSMPPPAIPHHQQTSGAFLPPHLRTTPTENSGVLPPQGGFAPTPSYQNQTGMQFDNSYAPLGNSNYTSMNEYNDHPDGDGNYDNYDINRSNETLPPRLALEGIPPAPLQDIDHDSLQAIFHLPETQLAQAKRVLEMNTQTICGAFVYGLFYLISLLPNAPGAIDPAPPIVPAVAPTNTVDIRNYMYTDYIKRDVRDFIRTKILDSRLTAYSRQNDDEGTPQPLALINMTLLHMASLPDAIKDQHLPPGFARQDPHAQRSVLQMIRSLLKHDRVTLRNLLLNNVVNTSQRRVHGAAPSLEVLYNQIHQAFRDNSGVRFTPINWAELPMRVKIRFAYLRLETAAHAAHPTHGHGSQWTPIDNQLLFLSACSPEYLRCWAEMVIQKDTDIFGLGGAIYSSVQHLPHLPTHAEVQDAVFNARHTEDIEQAPTHTQ